MRPPSLALLLSAMAALASCKSAEPKPTPSVTQVNPRVELRTRTTPAADVAALVRDERAQAAREGRKLVVYVGATWCEPCIAWHQALQRGAVGGLPPVRFLEFDLDRDGAALVQAGYHTTMVPFFALPDSDGRASSLQFAGVRKGGDYVAEIGARMAELLKL